MGFGVQFQPRPTLRHCALKGHVAPRGPGRFSTSIGAETSRGFAPVATKCALDGKQASKAVPASSVTTGTGRHAVGAHGGRVGGIPTNSRRDWYVRVESRCGAVV